MRQNNYEIPPALHRYETKFYGMSMTGLLVAACCLITTFLISTNWIGGLPGLLVGVVGGLVLGVVGWAISTPFNNLDGKTPPAYWLHLFKTRHEREIVMPELNQMIDDLEGDAVITNWDGEEIARL